MTSIRVPEIWQLQLMAVQKCAVLKLYEWDPSQEESIIAILKKLLRENNSLVNSSSMHHA